MARPITMPGPIGDLARRVGGVWVLAKRIGVSPRTIRAWAHGRIPPQAARMVLADIQREVA